jgi:Na+-translocating ferredoxin:NAD+ oxidoreductase subunit E
VSFTRKTNVKRTMNRPVSELRALAASSAWGNNPALVQLLGLCPLLAVTTTVVNGLALGLMTAAVVTLTNTVVSMLRGAMSPSVRIPLFVLVIASLVTSIDLLASAFFHELHGVLGLFIPLIITNCAILAQAETVASREPLPRAAVAGLATGLGFAFVLVTLGLLRELVGHGTLLGGFAMLLGEGGSRLAIDLPFDGMLVAILPPGAFFGLALLLAARNLFTREPARENEPDHLPAAGALVEGQHP